MSKITFLQCCFLMLCFGAGQSAYADDGVDWGYQGKTGPKFWGSLSHDYITCKTGQKQSPIALERPTDWFSRDKVVLPPLQFKYNAERLNVVNNGHTVQFNYQQGGRLHVGDDVFYLKQFHFHTPSEHSERGRKYDMEIHLVHQDWEGNIAVIGLLVLQGPRSQWLEMLLPYIPASKHKQHTVPRPFRADYLLPRYRDYYGYTGSLTTPPCSEGVSWFVMKYPIYASRNQIAFFTSTMGFNARAIQPINGREVQETEY